MRRALLLLAAALLLLPQVASAQTFLINRVVLRINDRIATLMDFQRQLGERRQALLAAEEMDEERRRELMATAGRTVMAEMYEELLLLSRGDQIGAKTTEVDIDEAVSNMRERMGLLEDEAFHRSLEAAGLTESSLRERLRRNLLVQEVIGREVTSKISFDEEELRRIWRENPDEFKVAAAVRLQDVVVLTEGQDPAVVAETARQVHKEMAAGEDVAAVARRWAAEGKTTQMVDLGWVEVGDLDPLLERAAWSLPPGGVSAPVEGRGGLHLLRLVERREAAVRPFEEVKPAIEGRERQRRMATEYGIFLRDLEKRAHIVMQIPPEAEGFRGLADAGPGLQLPPEPSEDAPATEEGEPAAEPDPAGGEAGGGEPVQAEPAAATEPAATEPAAEPMEPPASGDEEPSDPSAA
jgi:parvulin-like peptidyl-prolyl isomerase